MKNFELALIRSILVTAPVDMHFSSRSFPFPLGLILAVETFVWHTLHLGLNG